MSQALRLARRGWYTTRPNPRVGCLIVQAGQVIAEGWHYRAGEAHAEIHALQQLSADAVRGATVYVTLEPCSHHGKTGPCAQALIDAGIARVVYGMQDPNPEVSGRGLECLRAANITVDGPLLEQQARALNLGFIARMQTQRPRLRCKMAASIDGRSAMSSGESQWITGAAARQDVQRLRAESCAIISGIGSIRQDNSRLSLRANELALENKGDVLLMPPLRVILDSQLAIDVNAALFAEPGKIIIVTAIENDTGESTAKESELLSAYGDKLIIEKVNVDHYQRLVLSEVLACLANKYACNDVLLEAGAILSGAFLQAGLINECIIYQAPILLGSEARPLFQLPLQSMCNKVQLCITDQRRIGDDWRITANIM